MARNDDRIEAAIDLLAALTARGENPLSRGDAMALLDLDGSELDDAIALIGTLADRWTGARAVIAEDDRGISLVGDAATLRPLRLTLEEGAVLSHVLRAARLDASTRERIERALLPLDDGDPALDDGLAGGGSVSDVYLALKDAIRFGKRCSVRYRSASDESARERTIDPWRMETIGDVSYLVAWDVARDAQRRYRLDRFERVVDTGRSTARHPWDERDLAESIKGAGDVATLRFPSERAARETGWSGLGSIEPLPDGAVAAQVSYTSEPWLFDQVLAGMGEIRLLGPKTLLPRFEAYARSLLIDA